MRLLHAHNEQVISGSGDGGVRGVHDGPNQCPDNTFIPVFPASCPYGMQCLRDL
jgi:tripeptidyl-peptidase-1